MSTTATVERITRALERGPLYEGALYLVIDASPAHIRRALAHLQTRGVIERDLPDNPQTWRIR